jgi:SagB-type dehydrogenase family enzyme
MDPWKIALHYHRETKHAPNKYARSSGYLDWNSQPDPFRRFEGAPFARLCLTSDDAGPNYDALFTPGEVAARPVNLETISSLLELSFAISAWKEFRGTRWALRINPSSGNLHPTECYVVLGPVAGLHDAPGVHHYAAKEHALERRTTFSKRVWDRLVEGFPSGTFLVGLSSIHWRESWKYGERAYRYCQQDVGHALAALVVSAAVNGWSVVLLDATGDGEIAALLGLDRTPDFEDAEREQPDLLAAVVPAAVQHDADAAVPRRLPSEAVACVASGRWVGTANALSTDHVNWKIIDRVADACFKPATEPDGVSPLGHSFGPPPRPGRPTIPACRIIRQRRSAVALDGKTGLTAAQFYLILDRVLPRSQRIPFDALGTPVCVHLGLFVHLVEGLPRGLYFLVRSLDRLPHLREAMHSSFTWKKPPGCPDALPLYLLGEGDCRAVAWKVSCEQQIAGAGAFSVGMIAELEPRLRQHGAWFYRRLFWETGMIGQMLYLEAEAAAVRGTGIGCFFDDPVHDVFGLTGEAFQSLYHFTLGGPVEDARLTTLPPYESRDSV